MTRKGKSKGWPQLPKATFQPAPPGIHANTHSNRANCCDATLTLFESSVAFACQGCVCISRLISGSESSGFIPSSLLPCTSVRPSPTSPCQLNTTSQRHYCENPIDKKTTVLLVESDLPIAPTYLLQPVLVLHPSILLLR